MKNLIFFAILLIFILNIFDNAISAEAKDELPDPVLDTDGDELKRGTSYYIGPVFRPGGGVTIYPTTANKTCRFAVAQLPILGNGIPVNFFSGETDEEYVIRESTDLTISFSLRMFIFPLVWKVDEYDEVAQQYFVTADDDRDGNETSINRWFQIRKDPSFDGSYRFVFCPSTKVCEFCAQICTNVGITIYENMRRFALDGNFHSNFVFHKFQP